MNQCSESLNNALDIVDVNMVGHDVLFGYNEQRKRITVAPCQT